jgi:hypothetical protein
MRPGGQSIGANIMSKIPEFSDDLVILEKYQSHSAELVRLALLGIAGIGALFGARPDQLTLKLTGPVAKTCFTLALASFGLSAACGVLHRYYSTDAAECLLRRYRLESAAVVDELKLDRLRPQLRVRFFLSSVYIGASAVFLGIAACLLAIAFSVAIWSA